MSRDSNQEVKTGGSGGGGIVGYDDVLTSIVSLLESARRASSRAVNAFMTATYWDVGRRVVELEQGGAERAAYGENLLERLSTDLTSRLGRGFSRQNLQNMRLFFLSWPQAAIFQTLSGESSGQRDGMAALEDGQARGVTKVESTQRFPLPWSHYVRLLSVKNEHARQFYETESLRNGWTIRQLSRQISSQFYERTALSRNKAAMLRKAGDLKPGDEVSPEEELKDPFVLEFLGLKDEYSELELEDALIRKLEDFLLELGGDFTFVGRQRRLRIGDQWYRVDLLFFHRRLRCLVVIELKTGRFGHADVGQMHLYLNYAREHWVLPDENPPIGLILCAEKNEVVAHYALGNLSNKLMAAEYKTVLPDEHMIAAEMEKARRELEAYRSATGSGHPVAREVED